LFQRHEKLKVGGVKPRFKLFYLPPLPMATIEGEGHLMETVGGFTNIGKKRIEVNIHPPLDCNSLFRIFVHEMLHMCLLEKSSIEQAESVEDEVRRKEEFSLLNVRRSMNLIGKK
jgi:hypothetical protein